MNYYKITVSDRIYVARGHCLSEVAYKFQDEFGFDHADDTTNSNEFLAFEPLMDSLKVQGKDAKIALDAAVIQFTEQSKEIEKDLLKEYTAEEVEAIMHDEFSEDYPNFEETVFILMADTEPKFEVYVENDEIMFRVGNKVTSMAEYEAISDINI